MDLWSISPTKMSTPGDWRLLGSPLPVLWYENRTWQPAGIQQIPDEGMSKRRGH